MMRLVDTLISRHCGASCSNTHLEKVGRHDAVSSWGLSARDLTAEAATSEDEALSMLEALNDMSDASSESGHSSEEQPLDLKCA